MAESLCIGVDLGGTDVKAAVVETAAGAVRDAETVRTRADEGPGPVLERMGQLVERLAERNALSPEAPVGVGFPGTLDLASGTATHAANLGAGWGGVALRRRLAERLGRPVHVLNDVRAATLAELEYGRGREARSFLFVALGTGVGGGVVLDGRLRLGPLGSAGEIGHVVVDADGGLACGCGGRGCLETIAGAPALTGEAVRLMLAGRTPKLAQLVDNDPGRVTPKQIGEAARAGDSGALEAVRRMGRALGAAFASAAVLLHPERIVLGGGVAGLGEPLAEAVRASLDDRLKIFPAETVQLAFSELGPQAGVLGAAALAGRGGVEGLHEPESGRNSR